jgi:MFS family permease
MLMLLMAAFLLAGVDTADFPLLVTPIKEAFGLTDLQVGSLQGVAFYLTTGLCALPMGFLVDKGNRVKLYAGAVATWSLFTALSGLCVTFQQFFACRVVIAAAETIVLPMSFSLIADIYRSRQRSLIIFLFYSIGQIMIGVTSGLCGLLIGGLAKASQYLERYLLMPPIWRTTFFVAAVPGIFLAALFMAAREPPREAEGSDRVLAESADAGSLSKFLIAHPMTIAALVLAPPLSWTAFNALKFWMPTILTREFGFHLDSAGEAFGLAIGVGTACGVLGSGLLAWLRRRPLGELAQSCPLKVGIWATAVCSALMSLSHSPALLLWAFLLLTVMVYLAAPTIPTLLTIVTPGQIRGRMFAIVQVVGVAIAAFLPMAVGALSDDFSGPAAARLACLTIGIPCSLIAPVFMLGLTARLKGFVTTKSALSQPELMPCKNNITGKLLHK